MVGIVKAEGYMAEWGGIKLAHFSFVRRAPIRAAEGDIVSGG